MTLRLNIEDFPKRAIGPGRPPVPLEFEVLREMTEADLRLLQTQSAPFPTSPLKRITDRHHALARLLASGMPDGEAAATVGYDPTRVYTLKLSPAFQELLELYRREVDFEFSTTLQHMAGLSRDALLELRDRIEEAPEKFSNNELRAIAVELSDRAARDDGSRAARLPDVVELVAPGFGGEAGADPSSDEEGVEGE